MKDLVHDRFLNLSDVILFPCLAQILLDLYQVPCEGSLFEFLVKYCKNAKKLTFKINEHPYSLLNTDT